jgi:hypothetical protein
VRDRVVAQRQLLDVRLQSTHIQHDTCHTVEGRLSTHPKQKSRNVNAPFQPRCHVKAPHCCGVSRAIGTRAHTAACGAPWKLLLLLLCCCCCCYDLLLLLLHNFYCGCVLDCCTLHIVGCCAWARCSYAALSRRACPTSPRASAATPASPIAFESSISTRSARAHASASARTAPTQREAETGFSSAAAAALGFRV